jgi:hypothetical protein
MRCHLMWASFVFALAGCGGAGGPIYDFGPTEAPLRYQASAHSEMLIDTGMGEMRSSDSSTATLVFEIGGPAAAGREVSVTFEALELWSFGDIDQQHIEGDEIVGQAYSGTLSDGGAISVTSAPETPAALMRAVDPSDIFANMLPPLPPGGDASAESWSHSTNSTSATAMPTTTVYEGTVRFAGDTTWNGQAARIMVSEGTASVSGRGSPPGAPGEIVLTLSGMSVTRYIWDAARGVMLASSSSFEGEGEIEVPSMQMTMPVEYKSDGKVWRVE